MKNSGKKALSSILVFTMMTSLVACGEEEKEATKNSNKKADTTTIESVIETPIETSESESEIPPVTDKPNQTLPSDVNISETSETTEQPQPGKYTYTVYEGTEYEETFTLDVNIDKYFYIVDKTGNRFFDLPRLCKDLGGYIIYDRLGKQVANDDHSGRYLSYFNEDKNMVTYINFECSTSNVDCYSKIDIRFATPSNDNYYDYEDIFEQYEYYQSFCSFKQPTLYAYIDGLYDYSYGLSYDGIVVLTWIMSSTQANLGHNPFFYTSWENNCSTLYGKGVMEYALPF